MEGEKQRLTQYIDHIYLPIRHIYHPPRSREELTLTPPQEHAAESIFYLNSEKLEVGLTPAQISKKKHLLPTTCLTNTVFILHI